MAVQLPSKLSYLIQQQSCIQLHKILPSHKYIAYWCSYVPWLFSCGFPECWRWWWWACDMGCYHTCKTMNPLQSHPIPHSSIKPVPFWRSSDWQNCLVSTLPSLISFLEVALVFFSALHLGPLVLLRCCKFEDLVGTDTGESKLLYTVCYRHASQLSSKMAMRLAACCKGFIQTVNTPRSQSTCFFAFFSKIATRTALTG